MVNFWTKNGQHISPGLGWPACRTLAKNLKAEKKAENDTNQSGSDRGKDASA